MKLRGLIWEESGTVAPGTPRIVLLPVDGDVSLTLIPGEGGSAEAYYCVSTGAEITEDTATWFAWTPGSVDAVANDRRAGPISGVKIVATTADAGYELLQRRLA